MALELCFVHNSSGATKFHKAKLIEVGRSNGETRMEARPACGSRVDTCALETEEAPSSCGGRDPCRKCFPDGKVA